MNTRVFLRPAIGTGVLLLIPLVMTILDRHKPDGEGWRWRPFDFAVMGVLLFAAGVVYALIAARLGAKRHRIMLGLAILCVVFAIWVELAVGAVSQFMGWLAA